ncbi:MAG: YerC/YecD family TrpR-related protein [Gammaproteobacteria bacterium]
MKTANPTELDLFEALLLLKDQNECHRFMMDLCTPQEIKALKERWRVCQLLERGHLSYRDIHEITGASLTTIGRVARFLKEEPHHGYRIVLDKLKTNQP